MKTQERYYTKIIERYLGFCSQAENRDALLEQFASLGSSSGQGSSESNKATTQVKAPSLPLPDQASIPTGQGPSGKDNKDLSDIIFALRKLREGIVASKRADMFAAQAYLFSIRLAVLIGHSEAYHPAILHLLRRMHRPHSRTLLNPVELREVVAYLVLDAACRRGDLAAAYAARNDWAGEAGGDPGVDAVLRALAHDDYVAFTRARDVAEAHRAKLLSFAEGRMRKHALKCVGRSYLSVDLNFLEGVTASNWASLTANDGVGWELEGSNVVIRRVRAR